MHKQHTDRHQTVGGPPSESWLPPTSTPRTSTGRIHHESLKTQFWHNSGNVKLKTEKNHFSDNSNAYATWLTI
jgi:hypothetical protein